MRSLRLGLACSFLLSAATSAEGALLVLNSGNFHSKQGLVGAGRGIGVQADSTFSISSLGIFGDLQSRWFDAQIYSSPNGHSPGELLASSSAIVGGEGDTWYDIPISHTFVAGQFYLLHWRPTINAPGAWASSLDYYNDGALPTTIGPLRLIDGEHGHAPGQGFANFLQPNLRINVVNQEAEMPEPASLSIYCLGALGLGGAALRRGRRKA